MVKGWVEFQHYKDRAPPWIKLHKTLLDNYEYQSLPVASRALAPMLWLLASERNDGAIDFDLAKIGFRLRQSPVDVDAALKPLIQAGFFHVEPAASAPLADRKREARLETEGEAEAETEGEGRPPAVDNSNPEPIPQPTAAGLACKAMRAKGMADVSPGDPRLLELLKQGATIAELEAVAEDAVGKRKGFAWALAALTGRRKDAGELHLPKAGPPWHATRSGIVAKGVELGLGAWDEKAWESGRGEMFGPYKDRVFKAAGHTEGAAA